MIRWPILGLFLLLPISAFAQDKPYTLNPGDAIKISAFDDVRLDRDLVVLPDGTVTYPVVGQIQASGLTVAELQQVITQKLIEKGFLQDGAVVDASVTRTDGYTLYVIGQVENPGAYTTFSNIDVMQALSLAGGLTPFARESRIKVLRNEGGKQIVMPFDYDDVEDGEHLETNVLLQPGDTVVVPD